MRFYDIYWEAFSAKERGTSIILSWIITVDDPNHLCVPKTLKWKEKKEKKPRITKLPSIYIDLVNP